MAAMLPSSPSTSVKRPSRRLPPTASPSPMSMSRPSRKPWRASTRCWTCRRKRLPWTGSSAARGHTAAQAFTGIGIVLKRIEFACAALLLLGVVVLVGVAAASRALGAPIIWSIEVAQLLFLWLCIIAIDLGLQHERHFGIGLISDNIPPAARKILQIVNLAILIGLLVYLLQFAWRN